MNKSQLAGGIICLVIAAFLVAVSLALPPEKLWFLVGENNIPLAPIVVAVIGILLLLTAWRGREA